MEVVDKYIVAQVSTAHYVMEWKPEQQTYRLLCTAFDHEVAVRICEGMRKADPVRAVGGVKSA